MEDKVLTDEEKEKLRKERRKRRKYRLLILLLLLLGTGAMLATSTYAWFTSNKTVSVNSIKVNIDAKNGIQISADGTTWKSIVQTSDLTGVHATTYTTSVNQIPNILEPVSTAGIPDANGRLPMYYGVIATSETPENNGEYILTATKATEKEGNGEASDGKFIAFDLFFKVDKDTQVYLTTNSGVTTEDTPDTGIKNASRIAFVNLGHTTAGDTVANIQALNAGESAQVYLWEPNYDVHTAAGVANARDVYNKTTTETGGSLLPYSGIIADIPSSSDVLLGEATATAHDTLFKDVTPTYKTVAGFDKYVQIFTLTGGITKYRIYMWVEGQDVDCENNASGGSITFDLQISTEDPTAGAGA